MARSGVRPSLDALTLVGRPILTPTMILILMLVEILIPTHMRSR